jgi:hypothetical protein
MPDVPQSEGGEAKIPPQNPQAAAQPAGGSPQAAELAAVLADIKAKQDAMLSALKQVDERVSKVKKSTRAALAKALQKRSAAQTDDADDDAGVEDDADDEDGLGVDESSRGRKGQKRSWEEGLALLTEAEESLRNDPVYGGVLLAPGARAKAQSALLRGISQGWSKEDILALGKHALHDDVVRSLREFAASKSNAPANNPEKQDTEPDKAKASVPPAGMAGGTPPAGSVGVALLNRPKLEAEVKAGIPVGKKL